MGSKSSLSQHSSFVASGKARFSEVDGKLAEVLKFEMCELNFIPFLFLEGEGPPDKYDELMTILDSEGGVYSSELCWEEGRWVVYFYYLGQKEWIFE